MTAPEIETYDTWRSVQYAQEKGRMYERAGQLHAPYEGVVVVPRLSRFETVGSLTRILEGVRPPGIAILVEGAEKQEVPIDSLREIPPERLLELMSEADGAHRAGRQSTHLIRGVLEEIEGHRNAAQLSEVRRRLSEQTGTPSIAA